MTERIFESEDEIQKWLRGRLASNDCFNDLITNREEFENQLRPEGLIESKIWDSYKYCLQSLEIVSVLTENENISLKIGDVLKPDFVLYAPETQSIIIVELKHLVSPSRQAGTELSAYAGEVRSYIPFISDGDVVNIIISSVWSTLLTHYAFHEIFWQQRNILCLQPILGNDDVMLTIVDIKTISGDALSLKLAYQHLGGYRICLYDDQLLPGGDRGRLDKYLPQMKTAIAAMASKGNSHKSNGFAFLWRDNSELSSAPYNITIMNLAPFQSLERLFHDDNFQSNVMTEKLIRVIQEHAPEGHGYSLQAISEYGERFLDEICSVRTEGFNTWDVHHRDITKQSELLSFLGWGIFGELYADLLLEKYRQGEHSVASDDPHLGLSLINQLIDPHYDFINLHYWGYDPDEDDWDNDPDES